MPQASTNPPSEEPTVEVRVGRIGRAHGIRGELTVEPLTDEPDRRFATDTRLREEGARREFTVTGSRWHSGRLLIRLAEAADRNAAEALRGVLLVADVPTDQPPAADDEFWDRDLVGLQVRRHDGTPAGRITRVQHGPQDLLEIRTDSGATRLVPFVEQLVVEVDPAAGFCRLADVDGLLEDLDE
ncbi:ribosome maturation factor RimM [Enemella evansiae]|uniref:ribosome maturation factor RimM n=1 Tax=Enemella evansiae TaxID=2016499 RepID=UPI000B96DA8A|nr:ribosome maturation factor RimM [Enemella evansiae]OYO20178.1 ribosome maturation factor RimM [Enemella evansiae]